MTKKSKKDDKAEKAARKKADRLAKKAAKLAKLHAAAQEAADRAASKVGHKSGKGAHTPGKDAERHADVPQAAAATQQPDQVELLKLALRNTEAKLVDAEHRLRQVQQQLDDERRALAEASEEAVEDAVVDAAVAATVTDAVLGAELAAAAAPEDLDAADLAETVAETLDEVAAEVASPVPADRSSGDAAVAAAVFATEGTGAKFTPPLPHRPAEDRPSEAWTLVRLREEARQRGISGVSNLPKSQLVERLQRG
jgi:hypothetical protein